jgi:hypothetical protein
MSTTGVGTTRSLSGEDLRAIYRTMLVIRRAEERFMQGLSRGEFPGFYFPVQGMEAGAAGVMAALRPDDFYVSTYRSLADVIAKGVPLVKVFGELLGRVVGTSRGKGGTMHITDEEHGLMLTTGIVGSGTPIANGLALAAQLRGEDRVTGVSFGDGATSIGALHEALNLASLWDLAVRLSRSSQGHDEARRWAQVCTASGSCIPACPEGINPRKMLNLTKHTLKSRERLEQSPSDTYFKRMAQSIRLLAGTQMMPEQ